MLSDAILELYRAAQEMAVDEFQKFTIGMLNSLVPFDSARYAGGVLGQQGLKVQDFFLHNKALEAVTDYPEIAHIDPVVHAMKASPERMMRFHPPTMYVGRDRRPLQEYARRHEHMNGMSGLYRDPGSSRVQAISIFRADADRHFREQDCKAIDQIVPHFLEALRINRALSLHRTTQDADPSTVAIACFDGSLYFCSAGFMALANEEWPGWDGVILPLPLINEIVRIGSPGYCSANIRISVKQVGKLLFLKAHRAASVVARQIGHTEILQERFGLTQAETRVAIAMLDGKTAKEVAVCMKVSPHTVRVQAKAIYRKLGVNTRAAFVKTVLETAQAFNA